MSGTPVEVRCVRPEAVAAARAPSGLAGEGVGAGVGALGRGAEVENDAEEEASNEEERGARGALEADTRADERARAAPKWSRAVDIVVTYVLVDEEVDGC